MLETIYIDTEFITLSQLLKYIGAIGTGGQAKWYLSENEVFVDNQLESRRGRKLYSGQTIIVPNEGTYVIAKQDGQHEA